MNIKDYIYFLKKWLYISLLRKFLYTTLNSKPPEMGNSYQKQNSFFFTHQKQNSYVAYFTFVGNIFLG
jgi:uncharacterized membrane protein SpoIIM required for sporulation